ncbi:MAG: hypothetical protein ACHQ4F_11630 [Candidatus Dormibacteria bacterium]
MSGLDRRPVEHLGDAGALDGSVLAIDRREAPGPTVQIASCVVVGFGLSIAELRRNVTLLRGHVALMAFDIPRSVGPQVSSIHGALAVVRNCPDAQGHGASVAEHQRRITPARSAGAILGGVLAVTDGEGAVACGVSARRRGPVASGGGVFTATRCTEVPLAPGFNRRSVEDISGPLPCSRSMLPIRRNALTSRPFEISCGVVAGVRVAVAQFGSNVALVGCEVALETVDISVARRRRDTLISVSV